MGIFGALIDKIKSTISPEQHNGMEDAMGGIATGAAGIAVSAAAANPVTAEVAQLAQSVGANIPVMNVDSNFLSTPGGGQTQSRGISA